MRARHRQARPRSDAITSNAWVNRTRMKVVKIGLIFFVIASEAKQSRGHAKALDCFVAALLAMTERLRLPRGGLAERGLRRRKARDRHAVGRTGYVIEPDRVAERHRGRSAAMLAA